MAKAYRDEHGKTCKACCTYKVWSAFHACSRMKDGYVSRCRVCRALVMKAWRAKNKDKVKAQAVARREHKRLTALRNYQKNRDEISRKKREDRKRRPEVYKVFDAMKYAKRKNGHCAWANQDAMQAIYDLARHLTESTGVAHHVDHVVPLGNPAVQGLHVEHNLRVLEASHNLSKGNKLLDDDIP